MKQILTFFTIILLITTVADAQELALTNFYSSSYLPNIALDDKSPDPKALKDKSIKLSGEWYLSYINGDYRGELTSIFLIKRAYITVKARLTDNISGRFTSDVAVDREGDGIGDYELRLKYAYFQYNFDNWKIFHNSFIEFGMVHRPWLGYEQSINKYRLQGQMYLERANILRSADFGITFTTLFGGELDDEYKNTVNKKDAGKYGSMSFGIYNGSGYEALEENHNKIFEGRLSLRPIPSILKGFQVSWLTGFGKGNTKEAPDLSYNALFLSYEHPLFVLTGQLYDGLGSYNGKAVNDSTGISLEMNGYSLFTEVRTPINRIRLMGRLDELNKEDVLNDYYARRYIVGLSYYYYMKSKFLINYEVNDFSDPQTPNNELFEVVIEFHY